jgi:hypothetical protein
MKVGGEPTVKHVWISIKQISIIEHPGTIETNLGEVFRLSPPYHQVHRRRNHYSIDKHPYQIPLLISVHS